MQDLYHQQQAGVWVRRTYRVQGLLRFGDEILVVFRVFKRFKKDQKL